LSKKVAIIGIGNTLRRDDGIGIIILESLLKFYQREGVAYLDFGIASFDLAHRMQDYDSVLLIDGVNAGLSPGELKIFELKDAEYNLKNPAMSTHELSLKDIFEFSKNFNLKARIYVAGIQVGDTSFGEGLSGALEKKKEEIAGKISAFIDKNILSTAI